MIILHGHNKIRMNYTHARECGIELSPNSVGPLVRGEGGAEKLLSSRNSGGL